MRYSPELNFPLQIFITDQHAYSLHQIYQMIFDARYGKFVGMNHSGRREEFLGKGVK